MQDSIVTRLSEAGIKPSLQRIKILDYFYQHANHPSADQIYQDLKPVIPTLSKATVYNTLGLFLDKAVISTTVADSLHSRYDLADEDHGHFICTRCQEIYDFPFDAQAAYPGLEGFAIESEEIIVKGICQKCLENK